MLVPLAAAGPSRCVATWTGPVPGCAIRGEVVATAAGMSEKGAERALRRQLDIVVERTVAATRARVPTMEPAQFVTCAEAIQAAAFVNCFEDAALAVPAFCFVSLDDPTCWPGDVLEVDGLPGWRASEVGRDKMCAAVDARLVAQDYTDLAGRRAICAASCASKAVVSCPQ